MPTYEYRCNYCGHEFEQYQSMKDSPLKKCPSCGKLKLERLIGTGAAVIFKGSGFYETDYRSDNYKKAAEADKPAPDAKPDTKPDAKPDTKPDAKADAKPETKAEAVKPEAKPEPTKASRTAAKVAAKPAAKPKPRAKPSKKR